MCFGCLIESNSDQGVRFINIVITKFVEKQMILHNKYNVYYPQENGQFKSTNKVLQNILKKIVATNHMIW